jgi:hypothetical protein
LEESKNLLEDKIKKENAGLEQYQKHSQGSKIFDQNSVIAKPVKNSKKKDEGVNVVDMLDSIKAKIGEISKQQTTKEPLQLLYVSGWLNSFALGPRIRCD